MQDEINAVTCLVETKNMYAIAAGWNKKVQQLHHFHESESSLLNVGVRDPHLALHRQEMPCLCQWRAMWIFLLIA